MKNNYNYLHSAANSYIKYIVKLAATARERQENSQAVIYGLHLVEEAIRYQSLASIVIDEQVVSKYGTLLMLAQANNVIIYVTSAKVIAKCNMCDSGTDIIGIINLPPRLALDAAVLDSDCVVLDRLQDPGNLGTILRSSKACGVQHVVLASGTVDVYNPKVLRASQGVQLGLNIYYDVDLIQFIAGYKHTVLATTADSATSIYASDLATHKIAWLFGNEGSGLSALILQNVKQRVAIPHIGEVESLNVAVAASICLFEMLRQRMQ